MNATDGTVKNIRKNMDVVLKPLGLITRMKYLRGRVPKYWISVWLCDTQITEFYWTKGDALGKYQVTVCRQDNLYKVIKNVLEASL